MAKSSGIGEIGGGSGIGRAVARVTGGIRGAAGRNVNPTYKTGTLAEPKSGVTVKPGSSASKSSSTPDLPSRGAKPNAQERVNRARDLQWDKAEKAYDSAIGATGLRGGPKAVQRGPQGKNLRQRIAIDKEASKKLPVKLNSNRPWKSVGADPLKSNNARALKAANKKK